MLAPKNVLLDILNTSLVLSCCNLGTDATRNGIFITSNEHAISAVCRKERWSPLSLVPRC